MKSRSGAVNRAVDGVLTVLLLFLMAFQVTGDAVHEWLGIAMTAVLVLHHILNRKWYKSVFKGKYTAYRAAMTAVNTLILAAIVLTALSGMAMSGHAVPFMYGIINVMTARSLHLGMSHWSFILMGVHIGLHLKAMTAKLSDRGRAVFIWILTAAAGAGLWFISNSGILGYITFRTHFAFMDFSAAKWAILLKNLAMLLFFVLMGYIISELTQKNKEGRHSAKALIFLLCAAAVCLVLNICVNEDDAYGGTTAWSAGAVCVDK